ncbi:MAG TPA: LamG-like jellyroll fold domain-containing protein, partial [Verrucomicrobiae bacterium]
AQIDQWDDTGALDQQWRLIPATVAAYDFTAPAAPTGLTSLANPASVLLRWTANTESDLAGYTVLRSTVSGGPYDIVARGLTGACFTDGSVQPGTTYYYVVAATDTSLNQSGYSTEVSAASAGGQTMLANYNFENTTADGSINGNDAELIGSPGYATGKYGSALSLNGAGQAALVPSGIMVGVTNFTIAAWVYWNGGNAWQRIFDFGNDTTSYMFLTPSSGSGTLRFAITTGGGGAEQQLNARPLPTGRWIHVAVTRNGTTTSLYTNGVLAASGTTTISPANFNPLINYLGQSQFYPDPTFKGMLDSVYIFNYALTTTQLANLANTSFPSGFTWRIVNRADGKALDNYGYTSNGSGVYQYDVGPSSNQRWTINASGSRFKLQCVTGGLCLDTGGLNYNGAGLQQWASGYSGNQLWGFVPADSGYYYITNYVTGRCVDTGGQTANGAQMQQWSQGGSWNQHWKVLGF